MRIDITPELWAYSALIGEARRRSNENKRNKQRDRGKEKNIHNDLIGTAGELLAYKYFSHLMSDNSKRNFVADLVRVEGGAVMNGADIILDRLPQKDVFLRLDIKTFDCEPNKRFFAINSQKHRKLNGNCDGYICFLIPKLGKEAAVVNYVPYDDVNNWTEKSLGGYGDPSRNININKFQNSYFNTGNLVDCIKRKGYFERDAISGLFNDEKFIDKFTDFAPDVINQLRLKN